VLLLEVRVELKRLLDGTVLLLEYSTLLLDETMLLDDTMLLDEATLLVATGVLEDVVPAMHDAS